MNPTVKITQPKAARVRLRDRLFRTIEKCLAERPILWLCGPAGSGKTTLISSYVQSAKLPCLWYQIDERDGDIASFFSSMRLAVSNVSPGACKPMPLFTPEYHLGVPAFAKDFFEETYRRLESPSVLVFDNYQDAPADSRLHEVMTAAFSVLPESVGVIVISRTEPDPRLVRFRANGLMEVMGWDQIRFTPDEVKEVVRRQFADKARELPEDTAAKLHAKTDGWIAGIVLLLQTIQASGVQAAFRGQGSATAIFDYFAAELFEGAREEARRFLTGTAFLPMFSCDVARKLTGVENAEAILEELSFKHYFTTKHPGEETTYQYHPLFRDFLRHRASARLSADDLTRLKKETANLLVAAGQVEDAADLFIATRDWKNLAQLVCSIAPSLLAEGRYSTLAKWIDAFPSDILGSTPWLGYWKAVCNLLFVPCESQSCFEEAFKQFQASKDAAGMFLSLSGILEAIQYTFEDFHQLDAWVSRLSVLVEEWGGFPSEEIEARAAATVVQALISRQPQHSDFESWRKRALLDLDVNSRMKTLGQLAWHYVARGYVAEFRLVMNDLRQVVASGNATPMGLIWMKVAEQSAQDVCGDRTGAAQEGLEIAEKSGVHIADFLLWGAGATSAFNCGDIDSLNSFIQKMSLVSESLPLWHRCFYQWLLAQQAYFRGDLEQAKMHAAVTVPWSDAVGVHRARICGRHLNAVILNDLGQYEKADQLLEEARYIGLESGSILNQYEYCLFKAKFSMDRGREEEALCYLAEGLGVGKNRRIFGVYSSLLPSAMAKLALTALENRIEVEYVRELIRRRKLVPAEPPIYIEAWPWPLKIFVLGDFKIEKDGKALAFTGKPQRKPLALLKAITASGEKGVSEEQLKDLLWPEAEGDAANAAFKMALLRLRKLIGIDDAVRFQEGRVTLDPCQCWVDAWAFEYAISKAGDRIGVRELDVVAIEKALSIYKGAFLPSDTGQAWTMPMRERLRGRYLATAHALAHHWEKLGDDEKAASRYERTLAVDPLTEDFYRRLMACYQRLGRGADVAQT